MPERQKPRPTKVPARVLTEEGLPRVLKCRRRRKRTAMLLVDFSIEIAFLGVPFSQRNGNSAPWQSVTRQPRVTGSYPASHRGDCHGARAPHEQGYGLSHFNDGGGTS